MPESSFVREIPQAQTLNYYIAYYYIEIQRY